jgi:hypothetical protein
MKRKRVPLANYVTEYSVRNKSNENIPVYSVTNSQGFCTDYFDKEVASKDKKTYKVVPRGYFAYNPSRINVGSVDWQKIEEKVIVSPLYNVFSVSENMEQQYLYYFLKSDIGKQMIKTKVFGSVRDNLKIEMLKEMTIPERTVEEQKKCVSILDTLQRMISLRTKELAELDMLNRARFVEIFEAIKETCNVDYYIKGLIAGKSLASEVECKNKVLKTGAASFDYFDESQVKNLPLNYEPKEEHLVHKGDIIISRMNTAELTGAAAYVWKVSDNVYVPDRLWKAVIRDGVNPIFLWNMLIQPSTKEQIQKVCSGTSGSMKNISKSGMLGIRVKKVDVYLQNKFATFVEEVNKSKVVSQHTTSNPYIQNLNFAVKWL